MAIRPAKAVEEMDRRIAAQVQNLERQIDILLAREYYTGAPNVVFSLSDHLHEKALKEIIRRFESAGWKVEYKSDQRDGSWLEFSTK